ncbi:MAG: PBP1A family penicillin-binding protein [Clostridia bacterium]|nr:PBP1A family penicillin-binding protein [Clostridia bacterium]
MRMKKAFKTYLKNFLIWFGILMIVFVGVCSGFVFSAISRAKSFDVSNLKMNFTTFVYYSDSETGELQVMDQLYDSENRIWVSFDKIPQYMKDAVVSIEDERFYSHKGFDLKRIIGAAFSMLKKGGYSYGASTITQQLVKNITGDDEVTLERKIQEIYRALQVEKEYSKDEILELYLNTIYLSQQCNGVQSASRTYFGKDVSELTLAECASIAGITQYPSMYDPIVNPKNNKQKQEIVLKKMLELGKISEQEYENAVNETLVFAQKTGEETEINSKSYFVDAVVEEVLLDLQAKYGYSRQVALKMLYSGGLQIHTTADINVQKALESIYINEKNFPKVSGDVQPESAAVVINHENGTIAGLVGGRGPKTARRTLNRATDMLRQPGSTIKPIAVYAPAIEYGHITPQSTVIDGPITIDGWSPRNAGGEFRGPVTVKEAVAGSINTVAVKVLKKINLDTSFDFMTRNLGITSLVSSETRDGKVYTDKAYPALALGGLTDGVSVAELCAAYAAFPNGGKYNAPTTYTKVLNHQGEVILENTIEERESTAMSEITAYQMTQMLQGVINGGTGGGAARSRMPAAGKTGTTTNDKDRWFVGFTPYYTAAVWFGYDQPKSLGSIGYNPSVGIWRDVMNEIHKDKSYKTFHMPENAHLYEPIHICTETGKLASPLCALDIRGDMTNYISPLAGNVPTDTCNAHKSYNICKESGLLATTGCPETETVSALGVSQEEKDGFIRSESCGLHSPVTVPDEPLDEPQDEPLPEDEAA